jgi:cytochrome b
MRHDNAAAVMVWDRFIRFFHWALVILFVVSYLTAESQRSIHVWSGYTILVLLVARIVWGFLGGRRARLASFVHRPAVVFSYLKGMLRGDRQRYLGHNPLGGWGVIAMLVTLLATLLAGIALLAVDHKEGPLAMWVASLPSEGAAKSIHETLVNIMLVLVIIHIAGVAAHWLKFRENLIPAMFHGRKSVSPTAVDADDPRR